MCGNVEIFLEITIGGPL